MKNDIQTNTPKRWLSPTDLSTQYGFSKSTQSKLRMRKKIPFSKVGSKIFYCQRRIDNWIEDNRVDMEA